MNSPIESTNGQAFLDHLHTITGKNRFPFKCQWEITCRCNLKCVMCYTDCFNTPEHIARELSTDEIFRIMDEMKQCGVVELVLTGGEPMSRSDFREIYIRAVRSGFLTSIYTNGTFINEKWCELFKEFPPTIVEISYHGKSSQVFDSVTQVPGSLSKVRDAVKLLVEFQIPLRLKTTALEANFSEILSLKDEVKNLPGVLFRLGRDLRPAADGSRQVLEFQLSDEKLYSLSLADQELMNEEIRLENEQKDLIPHCHEGLVQFHIDAYGQLQLCSSNRLKSYNLRRGSFEDGFYSALPEFPCPYKSGASEAAFPCGGCS